MAAALALAAGACSPTLNWRDVRAASGVVALQFPCRPDSLERQVALAGPPVALQLLHCEAGGRNWAFSQADVHDMSRVAPALQLLRQTAQTNIAAVDATPFAVQVAGADPGATGVALAGRLPGGEPVELRTVVFAHGTRVHQVTVYGATVPAVTAAVFFDSLRVGS